MSNTEVRNAEQTFAWELRGHWIARRRVALTLSERCVVGRIEGQVERVSPTGAVAYVAGWHVPLCEVRAIHRPHFHERSAA